AYDRLMGIGSSSSAIFLWDAGAENAHLSGFEVEFPVDAALLPPAFIVRNCFVGQEPADRMSKDRELRIHPGNGARVVHEWSLRPSMTKGRNARRRSRRIGLAARRREKGRSVRLVNRHAGAPWARAQDRPRSGRGIRFSVH